MHLLLIEDDAEAARFLAKGLRESGYVVDIASDGREGLFRATEGSYDLIVADRQLPHFDGLSIVSMLRRNGKHTPVLILSALGSVDDRIEGLRAGGDDYLTKPFAFGELLARLDALVRRSQDQGAETTLVVDDLSMDLLSRKVTRGGKPVALQPREFKLLEYLMRHANQVVTRTMLLENVWDYRFDPQTNVVDVHVSKLRHKIDAGFARPLLRTIRNAGYMLTAED
jgi:two-component system, OmpR family, response regulator